jgi:hypothetical protein
MNENEYNILENDKIAQVDEFMDDIGMLYNEVAYHNITHAFDVAIVNHLLFRPSTSISWITMESSPKYFCPKT